MYAYAFRTLVAGLALGFALPAMSQSIEVRQPWVRGTVPGQKAAGAYMDIASKVPARLVAGASPVAGVVEIHNMKMEGGVMKMFAVDGIEVAPGKPVRLAPGGYHVMLMDIKQQLKAGDRVPLRLTFELADRKRETLEVTAEVRDVMGEKKHGH